MAKAIKRRAQWINSDPDLKVEFFGNDKYTYTIEKKRGKSVRKYKRVNFLHQCQEAKTDYMHIAKTQGGYSEDYLLSISVVEFYSIIGRILRDIENRTK